MEIKSRNPNYKQYVIDKRSRNKFATHIGFNITKIEEGKIEAETTFENFMQQQDGFVHGGVTSAFADMACGFASYSMVEHGQRVMTVEIKISYFNKGDGDKIVARGSVLKAGKRFHFCEAEIFSVHQGVYTLMAKASSTMAVIALKD
jgi:uncharacterized protein (TIGR00369 family)